MLADSDDSRPLIWLIQVVGGHIGRPAKDVLHVDADCRLDESVDT